MFLRSLLVLLPVLLGLAASFAPPPPQRQRVANAATRRSMAPKWDGEQWVAQSEDDLPSAGYGVGKTFVLQGPKPAFTRLFQADDYEQGKSEDCVCQKLLLTYFSTEIYTQ